MERPEEDGPGLVPIPTLAIVGQADEQGLGS
jgi:hypothetical protein